MSEDLAFLLLILGFFIRVLLEGIGKGKENKRDKKDK